MFERADRIGGLLRYGIPEFKMEKRHIDRRLEQMEAEGTQFRAGVNVGVDITAAQLRREFDAVVLAGGATAWRDLPIPGRELDGIHQAMEFLPWANRVQNGDPVVDERRSAADHRARTRRSSSSAVATPARTAWAPSHRQGAASVHQFEIMPRPPETRADSTPWPTYPLMFRVSSAHEEGGERVFSVNTEEFVGRDGHVTGLHGHEVAMDGRQVREGRGQRLRARGRPGAARDGLRRPGAGRPADRPRRRDHRARQRRTRRGLPTTVPGVFVAGDMGRGQSLIVWAIAEGRAAAAGVRPLPDGRNGASCADQADRRSAAVILCDRAPLMWDERGCDTPPNRGFASPPNSATRCPQCGPARWRTRT